MKILITAPGRFTGAQLKVSCYYNVELQDDGTDAQNKTFHALLQCFWRSIMTGDFDDIHSSTCYAYDARNFEHFRALVKLYLGAGMEKFINLANPDGTPCHKGRIDYRLKSWANYTKKERQLTIDSIITEMMLIGIKDKHFDEILQGMETKQRENEDERIKD
jgi:hypothetical protein